MPKTATKSRGRSGTSKKTGPALDDEVQVDGRPFWSGTLSFGLVAIPVELFPATRTLRTTLHMLAPSGLPVACRYRTPAGKTIPWDELERGYEVDDSFVALTDDELESLAPEQSRDIALSRFVSAESIPIHFFDRAYILAPSGKSNVAYRLLAATLESTNKSGIATFVMRGKQHVVAIAAEDGLLRGYTLHFPDEVRTPDDVGLPAFEKPAASEVAAMKKTIAREKKASVPGRELSDTYWTRLEKLVAKKRKHHEDLVEVVADEDEEDELAEVVDLVAILKQRLAGGGGGSSSEPTEARPKRTGTSTRVRPAPTKAKKAPARPAKRRRT